MKEFDYYKDKTKITNSMLGWMKVGSAFFKKMFDEYPKEESDSDQYMDFGNSYHCFILEADDFKNRYIILEESPPSNIVQRNFIDTLIKTKKALDEDYSKEDIIEVYENIYSVKGKSKDYIEKAALGLYSKNKSYIIFLKDTSGRKALVQDDFDRIEKMRQSVVNHDIAKTFMFDKYIDVGWKSANEKTLFFDFTIDNELVGTQTVEMKCKIDRILWNPEERKIIIIDLKTNSLKSTRKNYIQQLIDDIKDEFDYDRQMAIYRYAVMQNLKEFFGDDKPINSIENYIVATQTNIIYETRVLKISEETINNGINKAETLINNYIVNRELGFNHDAFYYKNPILII